MYSGTLIEDLIAAVERVENRLHARQERETIELERIYLASRVSVNWRDEIVGVA